MDTLDRITKLSHQRTVLDMRLCEAVSAITDLARLCEAVRYTSGLGKGQWERVEKARAIAAKAQAALQTFDDENKGAA